VGGIAPRWSRASDDAAARLLARRCNELAAELIRDRPGRFGGFACLPLPDVDGALAALAYALDDLQLDGVLLFSNARGVYLGDSQFTRRSTSCDGARPSRSCIPIPRPTPAPTRSDCPETLIDFTADTARAIAQLHCSSTFARTPDVKYIFAHAGSTVPYLAGRFGIIDDMRVIPGAEGRATAAETFRRLYLGYRGVLGRPVLRMLRDVVGIDPVLFGTDYPLNAPRSGRLLPRPHRGRPELTDGERTAVLGATATTLVPRLATLRPRTRIRAL
jgi:6-methylsalicylate decarboxylase